MASRFLISLLLTLTISCGSSINEPPLSSQSKGPGFHSVPPAQIKALQSLGLNIGAYVVLSIEPDKKYDLTYDDTTGFFSASIKVATGTVFDLTAYYTATDPFSGETVLLESITRREITASGERTSVNYDDSTREKWGVPQLGQAGVVSEFNLDGDDYINLVELGYGSKPKDPSSHPEGPDISFGRDDKGLDDSDRIVEVSLTPNPNQAFQGDKPLYINADSPFDITKIEILEPTYGWILQSNADEVNKNKRIIIQYESDQFVAGDEVKPATFKIKVRDEFGVERIIEKQFSVQNIDDDKAPHGVIFNLTENEELKDTKEIEIDLRDASAINNDTVALTFTFFNDTITETFILEDLDPADNRFYAKQTLDLTQLSNGGYNVSITADDEFGNSHEESVAITIKNSIAIATCGNGELEKPEGCDEGGANDDNGACTTLCTKATCGDGFVQTDVEDCDDNEIDHDSCYKCRWAACGDGVIRKDIENPTDDNYEVCDDGLENGQPGKCKKHCALPKCGDEEYDADAEECDLTYKDVGIDHSTNCTNKCFRTAPNITITLPVDNAIVQDSPRVDAQAWSEWKINTFIMSVKTEEGIQLSNSPNNTSKSGTILNSWDTASLDKKYEDENVVLEFIAIDGDGRRSDPEFRTVTINNFPDITSFNKNTTERIIPGQSVILSWEVRNHESIVINRDGNQDALILDAGQLSMQVAPDITTTYTLEAKRKGFVETSDSVTVVVNRKPDISNLSLNRASDNGALALPQDFQIGWQATDADNDEMTLTLEVKRGNTTVFKCTVDNNSLNHETNLEDYTCETLALDESIGESANPLTLASNTEYTLKLTAADYLESTTSETTALVIDTQLAAWWRFNGNLNDSSGNGHDGTFEGGSVTYNSSNVPQGSSIKLNQNNDINETIEIPHHEDLEPGNGDFSVEFWVRLTNSPEGNNIRYAFLHKGLRKETNCEEDHQHWAITQRGENDSNDDQEFRIQQTICEGAEDKSVTSMGGAIKNTDWHHVVVVYDNSNDGSNDTVTYYMDGIWVQTIYGPRAALDNASYDNTKLYIGSVLNDHSFLKGELDEIAIYNKVLTVDDIRRGCQKYDLGNCKEDADNDSVEDKDDNCRSDYNPDQLNTDGADDGGDACDDDNDNDRVNDDDDNCPVDHNPNQGDNDGDTGQPNGGGDACDLDDDNDGEPDLTDNCPEDANENQDNNDGDQQGDICDPNDDNDLVLDTEDNCPFDDNQDQADKDGDGDGDVCDDDLDGDEINNNVDNCPNEANADQTDSDKDFADADGLGDVCDLNDDNDDHNDADDNCPTVPNNDQADRDNDGIGNACDEHHAPEVTEVTTQWLGQDPSDGNAVVISWKQKDVDEDTLSSRVEFYHGIGCNGGAFESHTQNNLAGTIEPSSVNFELYVFEPRTDYSYYIYVNDSVEPEVRSACQSLTTGSSGLSAWYRFNDSLNDSSGNNRNGSFDVGSPSYNSDSVPQGSALQFDGQNDTVIIADNENLEPGTGDFSVEMWVKLDEVPDDKRYSLIHKGDTIGCNGSNDSHWGLTLFGNEGPSRPERTNKLLGSVCSTQASNNALGSYDHKALDDTNWHHVAMVYQRDPDSFQDRMTYYIDGQLTQTIYTSTRRALDEITNNDNLYLGSAFGDNQYLKGQLDEVAIYNKALTIDEIRRNCRANDPDSICPDARTPIIMMPTPNMELPATNAFIAWRGEKDLDEGYTYKLEVKEDNDNQFDEIDNANITNINNNYHHVKENLLEGESYSIRITPIDSNNNELPDHRTTTDFTTNSTLNGWWHLDQGEDNNNNGEEEIWDTLDNFHAPIKNGAPWNANGFIDDALQLNTGVDVQDKPITNQFVSFGEVYNNVSPFDMRRVDFSFSLWINGSLGNGDHVLVNKIRKAADKSVTGYTFFVRDNILGFEGYPGCTGPIFAEEELTDNQWHHVVVSRVFTGDANTDAGTLYLFQDGHLTAVDNGCGKIGNNDAKMALGHISADANCDPDDECDVPFFKGLMDEMFNLYEYKANFTDKEQILNEETACNQYLAQCYSSTSEDADFCNTNCMPIQ